MRPNNAFNACSLATFAFVCRLRTALNNLRESGQATMSIWTLLFNEEFCLLLSSLPNLGATLPLKRCAMPVKHSQHHQSPASSVFVFEPIFLRLMMMSESICKLLHRRQDIGRLQCHGSYEFTQNQLFHLCSGWPALINVC